MNKEKTELREEMIALLNKADTPLAVRRIYKKISGSAVTYDLSDTALIKCYNLSLKFLSRHEASYNFLFWLLNELPSGSHKNEQEIEAYARKERIADLCLEKATSFDQINDTLYTYSSSNKEGEKENYWRAYIRVVGKGDNARLIRRAVKFAPPKLSLEAKAIEVRMWGGMGKLVPEQLPAF